MIHLTIQTRTVAAAEKLAAHLMEKHLLLFPTMDTDHEELIWSNGKLTRTSQLLLQGMTKALPYRDVKKASYDLLGDDVVRIHAVPSPTWIRTRSASCSTKQPKCDRDPSSPGDLVVVLGTPV